MLTVSLLITSLSQPAWLSLNGQGQTVRTDNFCPKHLTLYQFVDFGYFEVQNGTHGVQQSTKMIYHSAAGSIQCLTPNIVNILKIMLMLNLVAVVVTFVGFLFDILGTTSKALFVIRTNGLLSITTVLVCSGVVGLAYYTTVLIEHDNRFSQFVDITYEYDYGFFIFAAAGVTALLTTASSLFKKSGSHSRRRSRGHHHRSRACSRDAQLMLVDNMEPPPLTDPSEPPPPYTP